MPANYDHYHRDKDYEKMSSTLRNIFLTRYKLISKFIKKGKVLDIGASTGELLQLFRQNGFEVEGVEPSDSGEDARKKGIKIHKKYFENTILPENYYDLVLLNHTLEHVQNPSAFLKKVYKLLIKGGFVYVDVPNAGGLSSRILGKYWPYRLPKEHISQFDKYQLSTIFKKCKFEIVYWKTRSGFFEYDKPWAEIKRKAFIIDLLLLPYSFIATKLNMGDSITFIGKK